MNAILVEDRDNVAVATEPIAVGDVIRFVTHAHGEREVAAVEDIQIYHKVAVVDIPAGGDVVKYGECIGRASKNISVGMHVHTHNVENLS